MKGYNNWINTHSDEASEGELKRIWGLTSSYKNGYAPNVEERHTAFIQKIHAGQRPTTGRVVPMRRRMPLLRIAASIAILVMAGLAANHFLSPTLEHVATTNGKLGQFELRDGSYAILNGSSQLDFPTHFSDAERFVHLEGEAFFNVKRNEQKPFKVETEQAVIEVLGTSFNVRSDADNRSLEVFVSTGSVKVTLKENGESHTLVPGDLLQVDFEKGTANKKVDNKKASIAWKKQLLIFENKPLADIFDALESEYEIAFELKNEALVNCPFTINLSLLTLEEAVEGIEAACGIEINALSKKGYEVEGNCCE